MGKKVLLDRLSPSLLLRPVPPPNWSPSGRVGKSVSVGRVPSCQFESRTASCAGRVHPVFAEDANAACTDDFDLRST